MIKTIITMRVLSLLLILHNQLFLHRYNHPDKSIFSGRKGPGIISAHEGYFRRSLRKGSVYSETTSFIFQLAPTVYIATILMAILFIPFWKSEGTHFL